MAESEGFVNVALAIFVGWQPLLTGSRLPRGFDSVRYLQIQSAKIPLKNTFIKNLAESEGFEPPEQ